VGEQTYRIDEERFALVMPEAILERMAARAAELVFARIADAQRASPYLTVAQAAEYLCARPQRVYDLLSARRLTRYKDGTRVLVARAELEAHLGGNGKSPCQPREQGVSSEATTSMPRQRGNAPGPA
jgi:excisionase family DNA binding protein